MKCPSCHKNNSIFHEYYGYLPCKKCQDRQSKLKKPGDSIEITSDHIKEERKAYRSDIEQPHRKGELNKAWLDLHGKDAAKKRGFTDKEIKNAKYVYRGDDTYYTN